MNTQHGSDSFEEALGFDHRDQTPTSRQLTLALILGLPSLVLLILLALIMLS